jgi:hypothetical protein
MPLLDHFHPPLSERRPCESFHTTWAATLADLLNRGVLPPEYIALEQIHAGPSVEIDTSVFRESNGAAPGGPVTATVPRTVWTPAAAAVSWPITYPPSATVEILSTEGGRTLVAVVELISPGNKDREGKRQLFAAKCAGHLARGVGVVIVDVVTSRQGNLHHDILRLLGVGSEYDMPGSPSLYAVAYRPLQTDQGGRVDTWPTPLTVGAALPTLPLSLGADLTVPLDLEAAYSEACQRRRFEEALR